MDHQKFFLTVVFLLGVARGMVSGQETSLVQIKAFDQQMNAVSNMSISINDKAFIALQEKKATFREISNEDLPPKSIKLSKAEWEVESWNYSKGTLEIIIRKKLYRVIEVLVQTADKKPVTGVPVNFRGKKTLNIPTGKDGVFDLPLALDEQITTVEQFNLAGYRVKRIFNNEKGKTLVVEELQKAREAPAPTIVQDSKLDQLDSIRSLTMFYAVFKNQNMSTLDAATKARIDAKFDELVGQLQKPEQIPAEFIGKISDSSFVKNDVQNLLEQAKYENTLMDNFRNDFDDKIQIISQKLSGGATKMNAAEREKLFGDLTALEEVLEENVDKFYKNTSEYRIMLRSLKASFSDIKVLEDKLSASELKRIEEQSAFRTKILLAVAVVVIFGALLILLILLRSRVEKQKKSLIKANDEIQRINGNLEVLVFERSKQLIEAYKEMDIFLYRASHDLRAPICTIIGLCHLALHHSSNGDQELVNKISNTAIKMDGMLKKLRMISEVNQPSNYSPVFLTQIIRNVNSLFSRSIKENNIEVVVESDAKYPFYSYPDLIEIILYNLVENALFFSSMTRQHHPKIHIMASVEEDSLFLSVYDNGIGIDDQTRIKLWNMFFVGHERSKGNGLGLYIVLKSVQSLNGKIDLETELNNFTRFSITIPVNTKVTSTITRLSAPRELAKVLT